MEVKTEFISCQICSSAACVKLECGCQLCGPCSLHHSPQHLSSSPPSSTRPTSSRLLHVLDRIIATVKEDTQSLETQMLTYRQDLIQQVNDLFKGVSEILWSRCDEAVQVLEQLREEMEAGDKGDLAIELEKAIQDRCSWVPPTFLNFELPLWIQRAVEKSLKFVSQQTYNPEDILWKWLKRQSQDVAAPPNVFPVLFSNFVFEFSTNLEFVSQIVLESTPHINAGTSCTLLSQSTIFCSGGKYHSKVYTLVDHRPVRQLNMKHSRAFSGQVAGEGCVYVFGGTQWDLALTSAEKFDLAGRTWRALPDMDRAMCRFNPVLHRNVVYLVGSYARVSVFYTTSETYEWSAFSLPVAKPTIAMQHMDQIFVLQDSNLHVWDLQLQRCCASRTIPPMGQCWSRTSPVRLQEAVLFCNDSSQGVYSLNLASLEVASLGSLSV